MTEQVRLAEQADRDLGDSGGVPAILAYPMLVLCTGIVSDMWVHHHVLLASFACLTLALCLVRHRLAATLRACPPPHIKTAKRSYCLCVLLVAVSWSAYSAWNVYLYGRQWSGVLAVLTTIGIVAGSTANLTAHFPLMRLYVLIMMVPSALAMAGQGGFPEVMTAALLGFFAYFMISVGKRHSARYTTLSRALLEVEEGKSRWRSLVENAPDFILTVTKDGCIDFINRPVQGKQPEELRGTPLADLMQVSERDEANQHLRHAFASGEPVSFDATALRPDGVPAAWFSVRVGPIGGTGHVDSAVVIATNVSERQRMTEELRRSESELRRLSAHQQLALENERRTISREIHDELGQLLTALKLDLAWLERRLDSEQLQEKTVAMSQLVDSTMSTVRRISSRLRPPLLDELGTGPAVDWLVQDICTRAGLKHAVRISLSNRSLPEQHSMAVFRICQEALTNIVRHARASHVDVELKQREDALLLTITDDGVGISPQQSSGSFGVLGMQERANALGGQLDITARPGQGTRLHASIPLSAP